LLLRLTAGGQDAGDRKTAEPGARHAAEELPAADASPLCRLIGGYWGLLTHPQLLSPSPENISTVETMGTPNG
jgi:hypothetical protein